MTRADDLDIVELGEPDQSEPPPDPGPTAGRTRPPWLVVAGVVLVAALLAVAWIGAHRGGSGRNAAGPSPTSRSSSAGLRGSVACGDHDCLTRYGAAPTQGVGEALRAAFPAATGVRTQSLVDPATGIVRSQYVVAQLADAVQVTVSVSYDGDEFVVAETSYHEHDVYFFDRHTFEGWSIRVTVSGRTAARHAPAGLQLLRDNRLLS